MLTEYIRAAMALATYEWLDADRTWYGEVTALPGVWASAPTESECRVELQSVLEDWILVRLQRGCTLPIVVGIDLNPASVSYECPASAR